MRSYPAGFGTDEQLVGRQAFAGLLWSKQYYHYDVYRWLKGDPTAAAAARGALEGPQPRWKELHNSDVILMPDTWEYPWYASWDLAFHCVAMSHIDPDFAKQQLLQMGYEWYQHANGQFPAYEWNFDDVNPPVTGWAAWRVYQIDRDKTGQGDMEFLKEIFQNEMLNFSFWLNRKDSERPRYFRRRLLGNGQHRRASIATSRFPTAGSSSKATAPAGWPSTASRCSRSRPNWRTRTVLPEHGDQVLRALSVHRPCDDQHRRATASISGTHEDQFFYDVILLPNGQKHSAADPFDGRPGAAVRGVRRVAREDAGTRMIFSSGRSGFSSTGPTC